VTVPQAAARHRAAPTPVASRHVPRPRVRPTRTWLLPAALATALTLLVVFNVLEWGGPQHGDAGERHVTALALVAQTRQSANDLSEMTRLYVSTRDPLYRT